jgi:hypothetical protein
MKKNTLDQNLKRAIDAISKICSIFLKQVPDDQIPLVFSFEFESGDLSFDFLLVHSQGVNLSDNNVSEMFFGDPLRQAIILADTTFKKPKFLFRVEVYEFEVCTEYDSTSALDQKGKPVMSNEIFLESL